MNFFEQQDQARRTTSRLVFFFILAVIGIMTALYFLFVAIFHASAETSETGKQIIEDPSLWDPNVFFGVLIGTVAVVGIASLAKIAQLSSGGAAVAEMMGGRKIDPGTTDLQERILLNVVEEMSIASGVPVPVVYVIEEDGINAFAAGYSQDDAAVAVTRGCLNLLNRDELQGVIAHEFSHVFNGDMRLNIRLIGILAGILVIGLTGGWLLRMAFYSSHSYSRKKENNGLALAGIGLALMAIGYIGVFFGNLIKAAVSRQREFLADASAVQYTRQPDGIANALRKIGGSVYGSEVNTRAASECSHMFFANALKARSFSGLLATHPPLEERIRRVDPGWNGEYPVIEQSAVQPAMATAGAAGLTGAESAPAPPVYGLEDSYTLAPGTESVQAAVAGLSTDSTIKVDADAVVSQVGTPTQQHLDYGRQILASVSADLTEAAHVPMTAVAVVYGLLLDTEEEPVRTVQLQALKNQSNPAVYKALLTLKADILDLNPRARLPLLEICVPALRQLADTQAQRLFENVEVLIRADQKISMFEYSLHKILKRRMEAKLSKASKSTIRFKSHKALIPEYNVLLSALAYVGHDDANQADAAFLAGAMTLMNKIGKVLGRLPKEECTFAAIDKAIDKLALASPKIKQLIIDAAAHTALADGTVTIEEAELLRAIADTLNCPIPPFLPAGA